MRRRAFGASPLEERRHERTNVLLAKRLAFAERRPSHGLIGSVDRTHAHQPAEAGRVPGNVRELENLVRYLTCIQLGRAVEPGDLPLVGAHEPPPATFQEGKRAAVEAFERSHIVDALTRSSGNIARAARSVGKPRRTFFALMRKYGIESGGR